MTIPAEIGRQPQPKPLSSWRLLLWFLKRPKFYRELVRHAIGWGKLLWNRDCQLWESDGRVLAHNWCAENAIDTQTALQKITNLATFTPLEELFKEQLTAAKLVASNCPVKMGGAGNLDLIYHLAEHLQATKIVETGVAYGWSSLAFLLSLKHRHQARLISTDFPYLLPDSEKYVGCVVPTELRSLWKIISYPDREAIPKALKILPTIDLCHYDSAKSYAARTWAYPQLWKALRTGGILISDDIADNLGFRDFCEAIDQQPIIVKTPDDGSFKYVGLLVKP
jgi:hypothetical protein